MHSNSFIAFEGGEGVGKTTQMKLLRERLPGLFPERTIVFTREPGGAPYAEDIRDLMFKAMDEDIDGKVSFGLASAARANHLKRVIIPSLERGEVVITDRFAASTFVYQGHAQENPISEEFFDIYYKQLEARPAITLIIDLDPELAMERMQERLGQDMSYFDKKPFGFHQTLRDAYHRFAEQYFSSGHQVVIVDGSEPVEQVHAEIIEHLRETLSRQ